MSTLTWAFHGDSDLERRNEAPVANHCQNGTLATNRAAPSRSSFTPSFLPPRFLRNANSCGNGQFGAIGMVPQEPSGSYAVQQFHPENSLPSPQQRPPQQQKSSSGSTVISERYKTELCRPFEESGVCRYGHKCQFAHGSCELRTLSRHPKYKTEPCRTFHSSGYCPYGTRCHFIHNWSTQQPVPSGSASEEQCSTDGDGNGDLGQLGFNQEPQPQPGMMQTVSSASPSGLPSGHNHPVEAPMMLNHPMLRSGMLLPPPYPAVTTQAMYCTSVTPASAASAAAAYYPNGGVPCNACANNTFVYGQGPGGQMAPVGFQTHNFATMGTSAYYRNQQQGLATSGQFPMPLVGPGARMATATIVPGAATGIASAATAAFAEGADITSSAAFGAATASGGPGPDFSQELQGAESDAESDSSEFEMLTRNLNSLLNSDSFDEDDNLSCSWSSNSLDNFECLNIQQSSRRLPIFSRLSDSDK